MPALAEGPGAGLGDYFEVLLSDSTNAHQVGFGYWRSPNSGGGPMVYGTKAPFPQAADGEPTVQRSAVPTSLTATFDRSRNEVIVVVPRADVEAALGIKLADFTPALMLARTETVDPMPSYRPRTVDGNAITRKPFSFSACDRALATLKTTAPAMNPCAVDLAFPTGDEESYAPPVGTAETRDDSLDVDRVRYLASAKDLTIRLDIARLADSPVIGTGQGYFAKFNVQGTFVSVGAYRDSQAGTHPDGTGLKVTPPVAVVFDAVHDQVTLTVHRADLATALGLTSTAALVLSSAGATTDARLDGSGLYTGDDSAIAPAAVLSFRACDASHPA